MSNMQRHHSIADNFVPLDVNGLQSISSGNGLCSRHAGVSLKARHSFVETMRPHPDLAQALSELEKLSEPENHCGPLDAAGETSPNGTEGSDSQPRDGPPAARLNRAYTIPIPSAAPPWIISDVLVPAAFIFTYLLGRLGFHPLWLVLLLYWLRQVNPKATGKGLTGAETDGAEHCPNCGARVSRGDAGGDNGSLGFSHVENHRAPSEGGLSSYLDEVGPFESGEWLARVFGLLWSFYTREWEAWLKELIVLNLNWYKPDYIESIRVDEMELGPVPIIQGVRFLSSPPSDWLEFDLHAYANEGMRAVLSIKVKTVMGAGVRVPVSLKLKKLCGDLRLKMQLVKGEPYVGLLTLQFLHKPSHQICIQEMSTRLNLTEIPLLSKWLKTTLDKGITDWAVSNPIVCPFQEWWNAPIPPTTTGPTHPSTHSGPLTTPPQPSSPTSGRRAHSLDIMRGFRLGNGKCGGILGSAFGRKHGPKDKLANEQVSVFVMEGGLEPGIKGGRVGLVTVQVVEAEKLPNADPFGDMRAFCVVSLRHKDHVRTKYQSKRMENTREPWWWETFELVAPDVDNDVIVLSVYNHHFMTKPDLVGEVRFPVAKLACGAMASAGSSQGIGSPNYGPDAAVDPSRRPEGNVSIIGVHDGPLDVKVTGSGLGSASMVSWYRLQGGAREESGRIRVGIAVRLLEQVYEDGLSDAASCDSGDEGVAIDGRGSYMPVGSGSIMPPTISSPTSSQVSLEVLHMRLVRAELSRSFIMLPLDPYCIIELGATSWRSSWQRLTLSPVFHEICDFILKDDDKPRELKIQVWNRNRTRTDEVLGSSKYPLTDLKYGVAHNLWLELEGGRKPFALQGRVNLVLRLLPFRIVT